MAKECKTTLHLFDSFEKVVAEDLIECDNEYYLENVYKCDVTEPETVLKQFDNVKINVCRVPANFDTVQNIAFLYIDLNLYTSTKIALNELWSKIVSGGMAFIDLHDSYSSGAEVAVKEFFESLGIDVQMLPTGIAVVYKP